MRLEDKVGIGVLVSAAAGVGFMFSCLGGAWGSRGVNDVFTFQYQGKPAVVKHRDIRMGPDVYWILLDNRDEVYYGNLVSDDGKLITIGKGGHSVRDYNPEKE